MDKIVEAIHQQLILSYTQAGRVVPTTVGVVAAALQDALQFSNVEEVHNAFRRARDMADIPTQRVLKDALTNHRHETTPENKPERLIGHDDKSVHIGKRIPSEKQRRYFWAVHSLTSPFIHVENAWQIISEFEADPRNKEYVDYMDREGRMKAAEKASSETCNGIFNRYQIF